MILWMILLIVVSPIVVSWMSIFAKRMRQRRQVQAVRGQGAELEVLLDSLHVPAPEMPEVSPEERIRRLG